MNRILFSLTVLVLAVVAGSNAQSSITAANRLGIGTNLAGGIDTGYGPMINPFGGSDTGYGPMINPFGGSDAGYGPMINPFGGSDTGYGPMINPFGGAGTVNAGAINHTKAEAWYRPMKSLSEEMLPSP